MSEWMLVDDIELLAEKSLFCMELHFIRMAYFAGVVSGLYIAREYARVEVTKPDPKLWSLLSGNEFPRPSLTQFVSKLCQYTGPKFQFFYGWILEPGLRYGDPGIYYAMGMSDAVSIAIRQVPRLFKHVKGDDWKMHTQAWIDSKLRWASFNLMVETAANR